MTIEIIIIGLTVTMWLIAGVNAYLAKRNKIL